MAEDLNKAISQIAQMLGMPSSGPTNATGGAESSSAPAQPDHPPQAYYPQSPGGLGNVDIIARARDMLDSFNNVSDPRINLLHSIHPFLSPARQSSCASCIQLLKIISVISAISPGNRSSGPKG